MAFVLNAFLVLWRNSKGKWTRRTDNDERLLEILDHIGYGIYPVFLCDDLGFRGLRLAG